MKNKCLQYKNTYYLEHEAGWTNDGDIDKSLFYSDQLHLIKDGNIKLAEEISREIEKLRNKNYHVGERSQVHVHSPHTTLHISERTHMFCVEESSLSRSFKHEKCEYVHSPTTPTISSQTLNSPALLPHRHARPSRSPRNSSPRQSTGCSGDVFCPGRDGNVLLLLLSLYLNSVKKYIYKYNKYKKVKIRHSKLAGTVYTEYLYIKN